MEEDKNPPEFLICWNCGSKTPPGECNECHVQLMRASKIKKSYEPLPVKNIIEIKHHGKIIRKLDLDELSAVVSQHFTITKSIMTATPRFLVNPPDSELEPVFSDLIHDSQKLLAGLTPKIERVSNRRKDLIIQYAYFEPITNIQFRKTYLLIGFTLMSMFFAGLYNFLKISKAKGQNVDTFWISGLPFSLNAVIFATQFSITLFIILITKDVIQVLINKRYDDTQLTPYYIPAPPIFEFGTLGSYMSQKRIHKSNKSLFYSALWGPIIAWLLSIIIILYSLQWSSFNPSAAQKYSGHSLAADNGYEPLGLKFLSIIASSLNFWDGEGILVQNYVLSPITLAGIIGFYFSGLSLLPASHLNGGYLIRSKYGKQVHIFTSYLILGISLLLFGLIALLFFILIQRLGVPEVLNEESEAPKSAVLWIIITLIIAFLSIPIPL